MNILRFTRDDEFFYYLRVCNILMGQDAVSQLCLVTYSTAEQQREQNDALLAIYVLYNYCQMRKLS